MRSRSSEFDRHDYRRMDNKYCVTVFIRGQDRRKIDKNKSKDKRIHKDKYEKKSEMWNM